MPPTSPPFSVNDDISFVKILRFDVKISHVGVSAAFILGTNASFSIKGSTAGKRYSPQFVKAAKLLCWNGHFKPWGRTASYAEIWEKWYVPDPTGKFSLIRRHSEAYEAK